MIRWKLRGWARTRHSNYLCYHPMNTCTVDSLLKSPDDSHTVLSPSEISSKWTQLNVMGSMKSRGALGAQRRNIYWPCVPAVTSIGFGIRNSQVQILTHTVISCVNFGELFKHSGTQKCKGNLIIQVIQNNTCWEWARKTSQRRWHHVLTTEWEFSRWKGEARASGRSSRGKGLWPQRTTCSVLISGYSVQRGSGRTGPRKKVKGQMGTDLECHAKWLQAHTSSDKSPSSRMCLGHT